MPKERSDDFSSWSEKLEKPEGIPGLNMSDKGAAWEKLSGRLKGQELPSMLQKGPVFQKARFWIAAACLFMALIPAGIMLKGIIKNKTTEDKSDREMVTRTIPKLPAGPVFPENPVFRENKDKPVNRTKPGVILKNADQVFSSKSSKTKLNKEIITGTLITGDVDFPKKDSANLSSLYSSESVDSGLHLAQQTVLPEKRKKELRVVHINEINDPAITGPSLTGIRVERGFRINLGYRGMFNHPSVAANLPDPSVLKIKTSSQNQ